MSKTIAQKMFDIQQRLKPLMRDSDNPFFKSKYADLNQCLAVAKEECGKEGLLLVQAPDVKEGFKGVRTDVIDVATDTTVGCFVSFSGNEKNAQEIGATITYSRRFGIVSLFAMEQADDDGETAVGRGAGQGSNKSIDSGTVSPKPGVTVVPSDSQNKPATAKTEALPTKRETTNKKITLIGNVIVQKFGGTNPDKQKRIQEEVMQMLYAFGVKAKEELTDEQAGKFLEQLTERVNK